MADPSPATNAATTARLGIGVPVCTTSHGSNSTSITIEPVISEWTISSDCASRVREYGSDSRRSEL